MREIFASSLQSPVANNPGIWLPYGVSDVPITNDTVSVIGVANQEQFWQFVPTYSISIGHVSILVSTGLAGAFAGIAIYSGDGLTKLAAADAFSVATSGQKRPALSSILNLMAGTSYWLGFCATDTTTLAFLNILQTGNYAATKNAGAVRYGRNTVNLTAGGVTLPSVSNVTSTTLRVPLMYFDA